MSNIDAILPKLDEYLERERTRTFNLADAYDSQQPGFRLREQDSYRTRVDYWDGEACSTIFDVLRPMVPSGHGRFSPRDIGAFVGVQMALSNGFCPNIIPWNVDFLERPTPVLVIDQEAKIVIETPFPRPFGEWVRAAKEVTTAVKDIHSLGLIHGNLHKDNVLFDVGGHAHVVNVATHVLYDEHPGQLFPAQWRWMAPELLIPPVGSDDVAPATRQSDVHSLGLVLLWMATGQVLFDNHKSRGSLIRETGRHPHAARDLATSNNLPGGVQDLLCACVAHNPTQRPTAQDVLDTLEALH